ncbi:MAG: helix-turn-helix domain-containing protein [Rhodospirillaceae bacterium]|nr:MAG: helix-turn-helix domain-containing protein [Rhodospirillaceae bacterium]
MPEFAIVMVDGFHLSALGAFTDAFWLCRNRVDNGYRAQGDELRMESKVLLLSPSSQVVTSADGRLLRADVTLANAPLLRLIQVAGFALESEEQIAALLKREQPLIRWLAKRAASGVPIGGGGAAAFLLAAAGLLDGGVASVPVNLLGAFRKRFPKVRIETQEVIAEYQSIYTAGTLAAQFGLAAQLVSVATSITLGQWVASSVGLQREALSEWKISGDPLVASAQYWMLEHFHQPFRVVDLAAMLAVSHKTLIRRFNSALNTTPHAYARGIRMHSAARMLHLTRLSVERIALAVGYSDPSSFRRLFTEYYGCSPLAYRSLPDLTHAELAQARSMV